MWDNFKNLHDKFHERIDEMQRLGGLRIWILHVLDDGPKNGVEIMDSIEEHLEMIQKRHIHDNRHFNKHMMHAMRRPSPGSVYPMLKKMLDEKLVIKLEDGKYELTDKGSEIATKVFGKFRPHMKDIDRGAMAVEDTINEIESYVSFLEDIKSEKLTPYIERISDLSMRIENIKKTLEKD
jgi:DNA-binding PadR family transcriptional regulator